VFADPFGLPQALGGIAILAGIALSSLQVMRATSVRPERPTTVSSRATDGNVAPDPTALGRFHARVPTPIAVRRSLRRRSASRLRRGSHALRGGGASWRLFARPPVQRSRPGGTTAGQYERHHGRFAVALTAAGFPPCCSEPGRASSTAETTSQSALARMNAYSPDRTRF
jgi:hypothetical protein